MARMDMDTQSHTRHLGEEHTEKKTVGGRADGASSGTTEQSDQTSFMLPAAFPSTGRD